MKTAEERHTVEQQNAQKGELVRKVLTWGAGGTLMTGVVGMGISNPIDHAQPEYRVASAIERELTGPEGDFDKTAYDIGFVALRDSVKPAADSEDYIVTISPSNSNPPTFMNLPQRPDLELIAEVTGTWDADEMFIPIPGLAGEVTLSPAGDQAEQILSTYSQNS